jgi:hypothetical protein
MTPLVNDARRRALWEIAAVILTGATFLVFENLLKLKLPFLIGCTLLWTSYLIWRITRDRAVLLDWGLRRDTLKPATAWCLSLFVLVAAGLAAYRWWAGWRSLPVTALIVLALYPAWGFIQQFVVQALIAGNLRRLGVSPAVIVPVAAALFGLAHWPDWQLVGLCAAVGLAWTTIFLRAPNLLPLAFTHAWLGTLTYYWVIGRDPWLEMFGQG